MRLKHLSPLLPLLALACLHAPVQAETITIPVGQQGSAQQQADRPSLGMSQAQVEKTFGSPISWQDPKGTPPITRWEYDNFVVYFESNYVIHSVIKHKTTADTAATE